MTPLFSAVINCYNGEKYVGEAVAGVVDQTFEDWELILRDNRSTDRTAEIVHSFDDPRIRYMLAPTFTELGAARRLAIAEARGEWLAFLDSDDLWLPDKLEQQAEIIRAESDAPDLGLIYGRTVSLYESGKEADFVQHPPGQSLPEGWVLPQLLLERNFIPWVSAVVRRSAYHEVGGIPDDLTYATDYWLFAAIARQYRVRAVQDVCCKYRIHGGSLSAKIKPEMWTESARILNAFGENLAPTAKRKRVKEIRTLEAMALFRQGRRFEAVRRFVIAGSFAAVRDTWRASRRARRARNS